MRSLLLLAATLASSALAQTAATPVPASHLPPPVLLEMRNLESQFDQALARDCAPERCVSKGCLYVEHAVVDLPRSGSLPGLGHTEGPGAVPPQEYLTQARCEFAHEKAVPSRDVQALVRRLEQRLSKGWLKVTVTKQVLEPISAGLRESPPPPTEPEKVTSPPPKAEPPPAPPAEWTGGIALRELWVTLLPHFFWMIAVVMLTLGALAVIWGLRRVGKETLEEKAMAAQLAAGTLPLGPEKSEPPALPEPPPPAASLAEGNAASPEEAAFVAEQQQLWTGRMAAAALTKDDSVVVDLMREWLKAGEFELLAKAILVLGDQLPLAFSSDGEHAGRKVELAEYLKNLDEKRLPSDAEFFRKLNQHASSSSLLAQSDTQVYQSLRDEFGTAGVMHLIESLPPRHGALLFALVPLDRQHEAARTMSPELREKLVAQLLVSNRISREERGYVFKALMAARAGQPLPPPPVAPNHGIVDRGLELDAAGALSVLLPHLPAERRKALFDRALQRSGGAHPLWYEDIFYPEMLQRVPRELEADLLLEVDIRGLAGWSSLQSPAWQEAFAARLPASMQSALKASLAFGSRAEQFRQARRGHDELVSAMKRLVARGQLSFAETVA